MSRIECQLNIKAPIERIYEVSQDYSIRYDWDPFPDKIMLLNGATQIAKGVSVLVIAKIGLKMEVEFVQLSPPTTATIVMRRGPAILKSFAGSWVFKAISPTQTNVKFVYSIKTTWWSFPFFSERVAGWYFRSAVRLRLRGLKEYCEAA